MQVAQEATQEARAALAPGRARRPVKGGAEDDDGVRGERGSLLGVRVFFSSCNLRCPYPERNPCHCTPPSRLGLARLPRNLSVLRSAPARSAHRGRALARAPASWPRRSSTRQWTRAELEPLVADGRRASVWVFVFRK